MGIEKLVWPLDVSDLEIPLEGEPGSFWEDRGDEGNNCGVDLYVPSDSDVYSIESGEVAGTGVFSTFSEKGYWNKTYHVVVKGKSGHVKYAGLKEPSLEIGDKVNIKKKIGKTKQMLIPENIDDKAPKYLQALKENKELSMLHIELTSWMFLSKYADHYHKGNLLDVEKPNFLFDPTSFLMKINPNKST